MKPVMPGVGLLALFAVSFAACTLPGTEPRDSGSNGTVTVGIRSRLLESLQRVRGAGVPEARSLRLPSGRAIAFYDSWVAWIEDENEVTIDTTTVTSYGATASLSAPAGTGYTVFLEVYNSAMSEDEPVVAGSASGITITAGTTSVASVVCLPVHTVALAAGVQSAEVVYVPYEVAPGGAIGTETWYTLEVADTEDFIVITTVFEEGVTPLWVLFDEEGLYFGNCLKYLVSTGPGVSDIGMRVQGGKRYYLAVLNYAGVNGKVSVGFAYGVAPPDDVYEPNNTARIATPLASGEALDAILNEYDRDFYQLAITEANHELRVVVTRTSGDDPIDFYLMNSTGNDLAEGVEGVEPFEYVIEYTLATAGDYYIEIPGYSTAEYSIVWN